MTVKPFHVGLVVGKFCPLHHGHMLVIQSALDACDEVLVISYTKPEFDNCGRAQREQWIEELFPQVRALVIDDETLKLMCVHRGINSDVMVPKNDATDSVQREFVGWLCWTFLETPVDAVFTSEDYGEGFAAALSNYFSERLPSARPVKHVCVDQPRISIPISGTALRSDIHGNRKFMDEKVYASFVKRICILGGESSGKTTFAEALAEQLGTTWVPEFGRELWDEKDGRLQFDDMLHIARVQVAREALQARRANHWLVCDTSPLTTLFYSSEMFGNVDAELMALANRTYDYTFVCAPDFTFVQDGTRRNSEFRTAQHRWYMDTLGRSGIEFTVLHGTVAERLVQAIEILP